MTQIVQETAFHATRSSGSVSAVLVRPDEAVLLYVLAHGAGAGMRHAFMDTIAERLAERRIATLRFQFPYMERGKNRPDPPPIATGTVRAAVATARELAPDLPLVAGGKSFGGRMTSTAQAKEPLIDVKGLVFLGFPLHAPGRQGSERAAHLETVHIPMLFLQGTRDALADLTYLRPVCEHLGPRATLHIIDGGDHSFKVPKRLGRTPDMVMEELADAIYAWSTALLV